MREAILNEGQREFYSLALDYVNSAIDERFISLIGYAGTGKTFTIVKVIEEILERYPDSFKIAITAPTNKAVRILRDNFEIESSRIEFSTIHKLFGLKMSISDNGEPVFQQEMFSERKIDFFKLLIVDESSMLDDKLFEMINREEIKCIFMGDSCQIPPVGKRNSIPTIKENNPYNIRFCELTEIMRQAGDNPIISLSFMMRTNIAKNITGKRFGSRIDGQGHGVEMFSESETTDVKRLVSMLDVFFNSKIFNENPDYAKVIAWRNETVDGYNRKIRQMIYGPEAKKIQPGEKLIANEPIIDKDDKIKNKIMVSVLFDTNAEFEVENYTIKEYNGLKCYYCSVFSISKTGRKVYKTIRIIHEDSEAKYRVTLREIMAKAKAAKKPETRKLLWKWYYDVKVYFANVNYNYAITAHKAQGSTYANAIVIMNDIVRNNNTIERNRILYTAFTRPKNYLAILV